MQFIKALKPKNSAGADLMSSKLLKYVGNTICPVLTHLLNISFRTGCFPSQLKLAKVVPVLKAENCHQFTNYRPISLLSSVSKIFEKCAAWQLIEYLNAQKIIYNNQYGFRAGHSTIHPLVKFLNYIMEGHQVNEYILAVFIDLKKHLIQ